MAAALAHARPLDLAVAVDHNVVEGAPAARFVADLRRTIETADVLQWGLAKAPGSG